jgi:8-oxo-dGTP pyrophosphatase MutT (NUDIX family)
MATPDFVLALREKIGHAPLWLSGITAVVTHGDDVLMVRRSDNGAWTPVTGIIDPGEQPATAAAREVLEEAGVVAVADRLSWVHTLPMLTYENGDQTEYLDLTFRMRYVSGDPYPADGENTEARWFPLAELPDMSADMRMRIRYALDDVEAARFEV